MKRYQVVGVNDTITLVAPDEFVVANLDIRRTEQVVGNLLSNSIKYSPSGGDITISVRQLQEASMAELVVKDQGIGIPAAQHALLFNRFARASNARELGIAGTGLGLYLCRELIERQGGRLWFTSEEGKGSVSRSDFRWPPNHTLYDALELALTLGAPTKNRTRIRKRTAEVAPA